MPNNQVSKAPTDFYPQHLPYGNVSEYTDAVVCNMCGEQGHVIQGDEQCPACGAEGYLMDSDIAV